MQWLHDPGRDGPLNLLKSAGRRTQRLRVLSERLLAVVTALAATPGRRSAAGPCWCPDRGARAAAAVVAQVPRGPVVGRLVGVPGLPPGYVAREELAGLIAAVTATDTAVAVARSG